MASNFGLVERGATRVFALMLSVVFFAGFSILSGCAGTGGKNGGAASLELPGAQAAEDRFKPGLSVVYVHGFYRTLAQMPSEKRAGKIGFQGEPIEFLDHRFGEGMVFKSGRAKGVGMYLNGFIHFEKPGDYEFKARTNDGFLLTIGGEEILEDPGVHSDRFTGPKAVRASEAGWRPMKIQYFQRKGTSTIELYWKKPGDADFSIVPAEAYAHVPGTE